MSRKGNDWPLKADRILLKGGRVFDPASNLDRLTDVTVVNGTIENIGTVDPGGFKGRVVDCSRKVIAPGFLDLHVHLREPGREDKETIESGCRAAMAGGFTAVCSMPNTEPAIDSRSQVEFVRERAEGFLVDVHPVGAVTKARRGVELTEMGDMVEAGAVGFSDDGTPVSTPALMRRALEYSQMFGCPIMDHCEEPSLSEEGQINEGVVSTFLGMKAIPAISEDFHVARDLMIAEYIGGRLHVCHVSTKNAVELIRQAKKRGVQVTTEVCPHHFVLTEEAARTFDTNTKMKPPLRTEADRKALLAGLKDGTIDAIATDHAPHAIEEKETEYSAAAFGIIGLETAVGLAITHLVKKKVISLEKLIEKMSVIPRRIVRLPEIPVEVGRPANLTLLDPECAWTVDKTLFESKSINTPFDGWHLTGRAAGVINNGQIFLDPSLR